VVDEFSDMCWSYFLPAKSNLSKQMLFLIKKLNNTPSMQHVNVKYIRCDDAGENHTFQRQSVLANLDLTFEFTDPGSPQYNDVVERKFATLYGRVRSMLNAAQLSAEHRSGLWAKAAQTATDIENSLVSVNQPIPSYKMLYSKEPPSIKTMHAFGEIALLENNSKRKIRNKLENRGRTCLYLGRAANHSTDVGCFLPLGTKRVILSRDITWLGKMYGVWKGLIPETPKHTDDIDNDESVTYLNQTATPTTVTPPTVLLPIPNYPDANDNDIEPHLDNDVADTDFDNNTDDVSPTSTTSKILAPSKNLTHAMRKLTCSFNPVATKIYNTAVGNDDDANNISAEGSDEGNSENNSKHTNDNDNSDESANMIVDRYAIEYALSATISEDNPDNIPMSSYKDVYEIPDNFDRAYNHPIT
jgi:hypothetical protein